MLFKDRFFLFFFLFFISLLNVEIIFGYENEKNVLELSEKEYLLPQEHPLQEQLKYLFLDPDMFDSPEELRREGFDVLDRVHRGLMVASHPLIKNYLVKKFQNGVSQKAQLRNYLRRINGARALRQFIEINGLQHIIVPQKWLYPLPKQFADSKTNRKSYVLIVEEIDICNGWNREIAQRYYNIDLEVLRELCMVVYHFRGLDSMLHNMPFTYQNQIAFIDTERWERKRKGFLRHVMPYLSEERRAFARQVFQELRDQDPRYQAQ